jgi:hypothetical protein
MAGIAVALAGAAYAADRNTHVINVNLPDGAIARVEYVGDVPPRVTIAPAPMSRDMRQMAMAPGFVGFDQMIDQMDRQAAAMMSEVGRLARQPVATPGLSVVSFGNLPPGANSVTIETVSNGGRTCTRRTEVMSQGPGKAPKVISNASGDCSAASGSNQQAAPRSAPTALDRT